MMPGVLAQRRRSAVIGTPPWVPPDAVAWLDFVNGQYYAGGAERSVGTLLGGGFDIGEIGAGGYHVGFDAPTNNPNLAGFLKSDFIAQFTAGMTLVFDITASGGWNGILFCILDAATAGTAFEIFESGAFPSLYLDDNWDLGLNHSSLSGSQKIAITLNRNDGGGNYGFAVSTNGGSVTSGSVAYSFVPDKMPVVDTIQLFHQDGSLQTEGDVKTMLILPAVADVDLPTLSTP